MFQKQDACFGIDRMRLIAGKENKASPRSTGLRAYAVHFFCHHCVAILGYATAWHSSQPPGLATTNGTRRDTCQSIRTLLAAGLQCWPDLPPQACFCSANRASIPIKDARMYSGSGHSAMVRRFGPHKSFDQANRL